MKDEQVNLRRVWRTRTPSSGSLSIQELLYASLSEYRNTACYHYTNSRKYVSPFWDSIEYLGWQFLPLSRIGESNPVPTPGQILNKKVMDSMLLDSRWVLPSQASQNWGASWCMCANHTDTACWWFERSWALK